MSEIKTELKEQLKEFANQAFIQLPRFLIVEVPRDFMEAGKEFLNKKNGRNHHVDERMSEIKTELKEQLKEFANQAFMQLPRFLIVEVPRDFMEAGKEFLNKKNGRNHHVDGPLP